MSLLRYVEVMSMVSYLTNVAVYTAQCIVITYKQNLVLVPAAMFSVKYRVKTAHLLLLNMLDTMLPCNLYDIFYLKNVYNRQGSGSGTDGCQSNFLSKGATANTVDSSNCTRCAVS